MHPKLISEWFVRYYIDLGFEKLPGTSLLHPSIPMTFVMSAGLAQVETAIDQLRQKSTHNDYVLVQKCFRHFDVERIGRSGLHLSLFEMPGAFSFGHNSRSVTIHRMWDFLVTGLQIDPARLWATYFAGGEAGGHLFAKDLQSHQAWQDVGLPDERIVGLGVEHNLWTQGGGIDGQEATRKCGPNTELFFDRGPHLSCGPHCRPGCKCGRFVEFANSLFIFAEIDVRSGTLSSMTDPFTETVIGTERVAMILAGQPTVFAIDTIMPLLEKLRSFYSECTQKALFDIEQSERIIVDHLRALVFLAADGAPPPGKGGRRRLMRILIRRVLTQMRLLQINSSDCLPTLIDLIITLEENGHQNFSAGRNQLVTYIQAETAVFGNTLSRGYRQLDRILARNNGHNLEGKHLVNLVKQFGMPVSLLRVALARRGCEFKEQEYSRAMEQWRHRVHASSAAGL